jgi:hypothetical protein
MNDGPFIFANQNDNGVTHSRLVCEDLGLTDGVKVLVDDYRAPLAILVPPVELRELTEWLARSFSATTNRMPTGTEAMFERMLKQTGMVIKIQSGDKTRFKQLLRVIQGKGLY